MAKNVDPLYMHNNTHNSVHELHREILSGDLISSLIYPLTAGVVGTLQMVSQPVFSIFPCSPLPSGATRA